MMDHLEVTPARLASAASSIQTAADEIDGILLDLERQATTLRSQWSGEARLAFDAAQDRFQASMASRTEAVGQITKALTALAVSYSDADLAAAQALGASA